MLCLSPSARHGDGSTISGSAALPPSPRLRSGRQWANGTFAYWHPLLFSHPASLRQSPVAQRRPTLRPPASPKPCPIHGPSRNGDSDSFVTVAVNSCAFDSLGATTSRDRASNWSLPTVEPVSPPRKRKLEKREQRPAPETRVQSSEMPQIADQRPVPDRLTCRNVDAFPFWGTYNPETQLAS